MNFFEIMKYFARAIEQMRAVDGILIPQFPWPEGKQDRRDCCTSLRFDWIIQYEVQ